MRLCFTPFHQLVDLVDNRLPDAEVETLRKHLDSCERCTQTVADLERVIGLMQRDRAADAPPHVIAAAIQLFQPPAATPTSPLRQRLHALLQMASGHPTAAFGTRTTRQPEQPAVRRLYAQAAPYMVDLQITPSDTGWAVGGQVLGDLAEEGTVTIEGADHTMEAMLNELGEFFLPALPDGAYRLVISFSDTEIEITDLVLGKP